MVDINKYPVGVQSFRKIREADGVYVDKTEYVYRLAQQLSSYFFLGRPRRFGKSLFVSTLEAYFEGEKSLFKGLAIEKLEKDWTKYPVIKFNLADGKHKSKEELERFLNYLLDDQFEKFGVGSTRIGANNRLVELIKKVYTKNSQKVVVLIDEYDAPLLDVVHNEDDLMDLRMIMRNFYSPLKGCEEYLRFVFLTGITKFSQMSIFSEFNNICNISLDDEFSGICGITETELFAQLKEHVQYFAERQGITEEEAVIQLKQNYDGYHFTWPSEDIFNPYSVMNAFWKGKIDAYWFDSGTPTYLIEMLRKFKVASFEIGGMKATAEDFDCPMERMESATALLYQSGYITIKGKDSMGFYQLEIPNKEVRMGLMNSLIPYYIAPQVTTAKVKGILSEMVNALSKGDIDLMLNTLRQFLNSLPYCDNTDYEGHWQQVLYVIFTLMGQYVDVEVRTSTGRIDMVMLAYNKLYIIELKMNQSADDALRQIDLKRYSDRFALCHYPIVKVGIAFDREAHSLGEWKVEG